MEKMRHTSSHSSTTDIEIDRGVRALTNEVTQAHPYTTPLDDSHTDCAKSQMWTVYGLEPVRTSAAVLNTGAVLMVTLTFPNLLPFIIDKGFILYGHVAPGSLAMITLSIQKTASRLLINLIQSNFLCTQLQFDSSYWSRYPLSSIPCSK